MADTVDVIIGNVILTGVLIIGLVLFVASSVALSDLYSMRVEENLTERLAVYVAQSVDQLYIASNSTYPLSSQNVALSLQMPETLGGRIYTLELLNTSPASGVGVNLTVVVTVPSLHVSGSSSVALGSCNVAARTFYAEPYPELTVFLRLSANPYACSISFS